MSLKKPPADRFREFAVRVPPPPTSLLATAHVPDVPPQTPSATPLTAEAALEQALERGLAQADAGDLIDADEVLAELEEHS